MDFRYIFFQLLLALDYHGKSWILTTADGPQISTDDTWRRFLKILDCSCVVLICALYQVKDNNSGRNTIFRYNRLQCLIKPQKYYQLLQEFEHDLLNTFCVTRLENSEVQLCPVSRRCRENLSNIVQMYHEILRTNSKKVNDNQLGELIFQS